MHRRQGGRWGAIHPAIPFNLEQFDGAISVPFAGCASTSRVNAPPSNGSVVAPFAFVLHRSPFSFCCLLSVSIRSSFGSNTIHTLFFLSDLDPYLAPEGVGSSFPHLGLPMRVGIERNRRGRAAALFAGEAQGQNPVVYFALSRVLGGGEVFFFSVFVSLYRNQLARSG